MINKTYTPGDGNPRTIEGKQFGNEFRVYRVYGDITKPDALMEIAQEISIEFNVETVVMPNYQNYP